MKSKLHLILKILKNLFKFYWRTLLIIALILWVLMSYMANITSWKAVFLDNDQVYFARYYHIPFTQFATLRNVYFLRASTSSESAVIVPLSGEPHGPKNYMRINTDHIIAVHILRSDSALVKTIENEVLEK